ncbi:kynurenine formamidase [Agrococcus sp. UYP10]|uniref:cyclase family protein n=1 Tax=Agrococcus sp. UYP10 TaxID=1756355 RepID=UPI00339602F7
MRRAKRRSSRASSTTNSGRSPQRSTRIPVVSDRHRADLPDRPHSAAAPARSIAVDGFAVTPLELGTHPGTHAHGPSHSIEGGAAINEIDPPRLMGPARILRVSAGDGEMIGVAALEDQLRAWAGERIALVRTGWDVHWGTPLMLPHPARSVELADALLALGVGVLGVDTRSPDPSDRAAGKAMVAADATVHERSLGVGGLIIVNLRGLGRRAGGDVRVHGAAAAARWARRVAGSGSRSSARAQVDGSLMRTVDPPAKSPTC